MGAGRAGRGRQVQDAPPTCGQLLQRYRVLAGLTQEERAERAGYIGTGQRAEALRQAGRVDLLLPELAPERRGTGRP